jgi:hypothetical protein
MHKSTAIFSNTKLFCKKILFEVLTCSNNFNKKHTGMTPREYKNRIKE